MNNPLVSITITTKNEEKNIKRCLESVKKQVYKNIEIIVVDNNSKDETKKIARQYTNNVYNKGPERSAQRNFGMLEKSGGKYLMFLDADMTISRLLIEKAVEKLENEKVDALYIAEKIIGNTFWAKTRNFERSFYNATPIDCVRVIRAVVFEKINGFDENLTGPEDWDLDKRIKKIAKSSLLNDEKAIIYHHENDFNLSDYLAKKKYYAKKFDKYIKKWGRADKDIKKQFSPTWRGFGVFVESGKWKQLIKNPLLTLGFLFLRGLVGLIWLENKLKVYHEKK